VLPEGFGTSRTCDYQCDQWTCGQCFKVALAVVQWVVYLNKCTSCTSARCCCGASSDLTGVCWEPPTIETIGTTDRGPSTRKLKGAIGKNCPYIVRNQVLPSAVECHKLRGRPHRCRGRPGHMVAQKSLSRTRGTSGPMLKVSQHRGAVKTCASKKSSQHRRGMNGASRRFPQQQSSVPAQWVVQVHQLYQCVPGVAVVPVISRACAGASRPLEPFRPRTKRGPS
jgi:hypothetical protein